jgi:hypothetical protein
MTVKEPRHPSCERCAGVMLLRSMGPIRTERPLPHAPLRFHYRCRTCGHETDIAPDWHPRDRTASSQHQS